MKNPLTLITVTGSAIADYLDPIAALRIEVFREFPYIYDGSLEYEKEYLQTYIRSERSVAILALDRNQVAGVSTGIPMEDETPEFREPLSEAGIDISKVFYCGESILKKEHRGQGVYSDFFDGRETHARKLGFKQICFCAVIRRADHPLRAADYRPLDPVWKKYGYHKRDDLLASFSWKDLDEETESKKNLVYWMKVLD